jgi:phosphohistidine phosphatase
VTGDAGVKTLTLLRHAKSGWDDPALRDFDRPLNAKGRRAAAAIGRHLRGLGLRFDHLVASPAVRVRETLDAAGQSYGARPHPVWDERLYLAPVPVLLDVIAALPDTATRVLLVGHNPGLEELVPALVRDATDGLAAEAARKYPTATVAELQFGVAGWAEVAPGTATLTRFIRPRDLDPSLGPDEI